MKSLLKWGGVIQNGLIHKFSLIWSFRSQNIGWIGLYGPFYGHRSFCKIRVWTFWGLFEVLNNIFGDKKSITNGMDSDVILHSDKFTIVQIHLNPSPNENLCFPQVDLSNWSPRYQVHTMSILIFHTCRYCHVWDFKSIQEGLKL